MSSSPDVPKLPPPPRAAVVHPRRLRTDSASASDLSPLASHVAALPPLTTAASSNNVTVTATKPAPFNPFLSPS